jgi:hypothetical protein
MDEIEEMKSGLDAAEDARLAEERAALAAAMPLFQLHLFHLRGAIRLGLRSGAMLHWASLQAVFGKDPVAKQILDAMLPGLKAMPSEPK